MYDGLHADLTDKIIACAMEVHRHLGPGLLENVYEHALCLEFEMGQLSFQRQVGVPLYYKGPLLSEHRPDLQVERRVIVEVKSIQHFEPIHTAQVLTYLRVTGLRVGLLLNFNVPAMKAGIKRIVL